MIEQVQRRATRLVPELRGKNYPERLEELKLESLEYRRTRADILETYRILTGVHDVDLQTHCTKCPGKEMFTRSLANSTRGHDKKLQVQKATGPRYHFFSERVINIWNQLSQVTISSPNINIFKSNLNSQLHYHCSKFNYIF